ncbi:helix-turn-helix domain-containing protein [Providencia manganoxydans]
MACIEMDLFNKYEINKYIGKTLKVKRQKIGMTGKEIGSLLKLSQQQISRYESGRTPFNVDVLFNFFFALRMEAEEISLIFSAMTYIYNDTLNIYRY